MSAQVERYSVRDNDDVATLIDWEAPHAQKGTAPKVLRTAWSDNQAEVEALYVERDRLRAAQ